MQRDSEINASALPNGTRSVPTTLNPLAARFRFLGLATGIAFLLAWVVNFAPWNDLLDKQETPLGGDYPMFYLGGQIVAAGEVARLYDLDEHHERLRALFPSLGKEDLLPYRYPPFVAGASSFLARLPYGWSWVCFAALSLAAAFLARHLLLKWQPADTSFLQAASLALCGWPVALEVFVGGQASFFALAIAAASIYFLSQNKPRLAGAVLALALYKPNVLIFFVLGCLLRYPRLLWGFIPVAGLLALASLATAGWEGCWDYAHLGQSLVQSSWEIPTPFWKIHGLISWLDFWLPTYGRPIVVASGLAAVVAWTWRSYSRTQTSPDDQARDFALLITLNTLFNPYPPLYDLVLLAIPAWVALRQCEASAMNRSAVALAAGVFFFGPHFSQALSWQLHGQLFTLALVAWAIWQWKQSFDPAAASPLASSFGLLADPHPFPGRKV